MVPIATARAQVSVYGTAAYDIFGFTGGNYGNGDFKPATGGVMAGVFYTFPSPSRFKAGVDGRITYSPGYNGGSAYTGALRVSFVPHHNRLRPYLQLGGGVVTTELNEAVETSFGVGELSTRVTSGALQLDFGLDVRLNDHIDVRAIDYGADAGGSGSNTHAAAAFLSAGIVYHFHPME